MIKIFNKKENKENNSGFFNKLKKGLSKTRSGFTSRLDSLLLGKKEIDEDILDELEEILFTSDLGVTATRELIELVREKVARRELKNPESLRAALKESIINFLNVPEQKVKEPRPGEPYIVMIIGVNGVGKTTTIGKVANYYREQGKKVMMVAADTFRAAAIEQLVIWGERTGSDVIRQKHGSDPSAVVFDAITSAVSRKTDLVLIDTAGRLHTKQNLMGELKKIRDVAGKKIPGSPHQVWLVLDATTGQNAISQADIFHKALGVTDIILTKLDGTAKGGIVIGISHQLGLPIKFIGIGEKINDIRPFDPVDFVNAIFE
ncbi:MAG: signal recognition particle-docking protein FtsY [Deltaproteobacteria bacterium]|nr:signal recognition particle-docking protein FtsY [Deltaproteobacteria bacterium]